MGLRHTVSECHVLAVHAGRGTSWSTGRLEPFLFVAARSFRRLVRLPGFCCSSLPPGISFLAVLEAREIASAGSAAIGRSSQTQRKLGPPARVVILLAPGGQVLAVTARAACESPRPAGPRTGFPSGPAAPAPQGIDPHNPLEVLEQSTTMRDAHVAHTAMWASQLHPGN